MNWLWMKRRPISHFGQLTRVRLTVEGLDARIVPSAARMTEVPTGAEPAVVRTQTTRNPTNTAEGTDASADRGNVLLVGDPAANERTGGPSGLPMPGDVMQPDPGGDDNYDKPPPHGPGVGPGPVSISAEDARAPNGSFGGPIIEGLVATSVVDQVQSQLPGYGSEGFWDTVCEGVFGVAGTAAGGAIGGAIGGPPGAAAGGTVGGIIGAGIGNEVCEDLFADSGSPNGGGGGTEGAGSEGSGTDGAGGGGSYGGDQQFDYGDDGDDPGSDDGGYCPEEGENSSDDDDDDDDDDESSSEPTDEGFPADDDSGGGGPKGINTVEAIGAIDALFGVTVTSAVNDQQWMAP